MALKHANKFLVNPTRPGAVSRSKPLRITGYMTQYVYDGMRLTQDINNAYATNCIFVSSNNAFDWNQDDKIFRKFIEDFKKVGNKYYNLNEITIFAPTAIVSGQMLKELFEIPSVYTKLSLDIFSFHSPITGIWTHIPNNIEDVKITFSDGIAYPYSGSDILSCFDDVKSLKKLSIKNNSPHRPKLTFPSKDLKNKTWCIKGYNVM